MDFNWLKIGPPEIYIGVADEIYNSINATLVVTCAPNNQIGPISVTHFANTKLRRGCD